MWPFTPRESDFILVATPNERQEAIEKLIALGSLGSGYYLMLLLSTLIVTPGLLVGNIAVIIGGMLIAPLMVPLLSLSLSLVGGSLHGLLRSLRILLVSVAIVVLTSAVLTFVLARAYHVVTWIPERISPGIYLFIAFCSGVAGAFAWVKKNLSVGAAGVAIAVSLLPPLCAIGIGLALRQLMLVQNSFILLFTNLVGICVAAFLVFWTLGFLEAGRVEEKVIEKKEK